MSDERSTFNVLMVALAVGLLATACGADGPDVAANRSIDTMAPNTNPSPDSTKPDDTAHVDDARVEANGEVVDVVALDNTFRPDSTEVVAGTAIRWENRGRNDHDVVPADGVSNWGVDAAGFAPGDEYTLVFDTPGDYPYYCSIHGTKDVGMVGTIVVLAPEA